MWCISSTSTHEYGFRKRKRDNVYIQFSQLVSLATCSLALGLSYRKYRMAISFVVCFFSFTLLHYKAQAKSAFLLGVLPQFS